MPYCEKCGLKLVESDERMDNGFDPHTGKKRYDIITRWRCPSLGNADYYSSHTNMEYTHPETQKANFRKAHIMHSWE